MREDEQLTDEQLQELRNWVANLGTEIEIQNWWYALSWALDIVRVLEQRLNPYEKPII